MNDQATIPTRPGTLAEVVRRVRDELDALRFCLAGFLDEFYADRVPAGRRTRVETDPGALGDARRDALIGAIGEHLCHRWGLGDPPAWTNDPERVSPPIYFHRGGTASACRYAERWPLVGL